MKIIIVAGVIIVIVVGFYIFTRWGKQSTEDINIEYIVPDTAKTNDPILVQIVLGVKKSSTSIDSRITDISFYYKLKTESNYSVVKPFKASLSDKYLTVNNGMEYEQYNYFLPLYPVGTRGEIEYYVDMIFDGKTVRSNAPKNITLVD